MPAVSIYNVEVRSFADTLTGETELNAAEELSWVFHWYTREMRAIVERNCRQLGQETSPDAVRLPGIEEPLCLVWCDPDLCTAQAGGRHYSARARVETGGEDGRSAVIWLSQTPGGKQEPVVVLAIHDQDAPAAPDVAVEAGATL